MKKTMILMLALTLAAAAASAQVRFRSGIFLHHSTGGCIWGPNGSATSVPQQMTAYNAGHGYHGEDSIRMTETWFPGSVDNEWSTWHTVFEADSPENVSGYFAGNRIIMVKSCFPSSEIYGIGQPSDTASPADKTISNYKWHWRHIVSVMNGHRGNFFVIWTNAPLERNSTDSNAARLSDVFCRWAKDTLAAGLDPVCGPFPPNVHVFDFFHALANGAGFLPDGYRSGAGDSHPNAAATALVAPQLITEIFDAAIAYEAVYNGVAGGRPMPDGNGHLALESSPNPFSADIVVSYQIPAAGSMTIAVYDVTGRAVRTLFAGSKPAGRHAVRWDGRDGAGRSVAAGTYVLRLQAGAQTLTRKLTIVR